MILMWLKVEQPRPIDVGIGSGGILETVLHSEYVMPEWTRVLLDDPFEDWRRCKPCGCCPRTRCASLATTPRSASTAP